jgi:hypothetical protein
MIIHGLVVSAGGAGIDGNPGTFGIAGIEGMAGMTGIGGSANGIVVGIVGIPGMFGMPEIGGIVVGIVGIVTFGMEGIGGKVVGMVGIVGFGVVGAASGVPASVVCKRWRAAKLPLMVVKTKARAKNDQAWEAISEMDIMEQIRNEIEYLESFTCCCFVLCQWKYGDIYSISFQVSKDIVQYIL